MSKQADFTIISGQRGEEGLSKESLRAAMIGAKRRWHRPNSAKLHTLNGRISEYLDYKMLAVEHSTFKYFKEQLYKFSRWLGKENIRQIRPQTIIQYLVSRHRDGISTGMLNKLRCVIGSFFHWCTLMGYLDYNPAASLPTRMFRPKHKPHVTITEDEYARLKEFTFGKPVYFAIVCGWHTGLRISDIETLRWDEIDLKSDPPMIRKQPQKTSRSSGKIVEIPIHPELLEILKAYDEVREPGDEWVSEDLYYNRLNKASVSSTFGDTWEKAGLPGRKTFHALRHTAIQRWMDSCGDHVTVMSISGHMSASSLSRYYQPTKQRKMDVMGIPYDKHQTEVRNPSRLSEPQGSHGAYSPQ